MRLDASGSIDPPRHRSSLHQPPTSAYMLGAAPQRIDQQQIDVTKGPRAETHQSNKSTPIVSERAEHCQSKDYAFPIFNQSSPPQNGTESQQKFNPGFPARKRAIDSLETHIRCQREVQLGFNDTTAQRNDIVLCCVVQQHNNRTSGSFCCSATGNEQASWGTYTREMHESHIRRQRDRKSSAGFKL
jgi:hypothetical protein